MQPTEAEWVGAYEAWSDEIDATLGAGRTVFRAACVATFDDEVGSPPTGRLEPLAATTRRGCAELTPAGWRRTQEDVVRALVSANSEPLPPRRRPALTEIASSSVGVRPKVYCWSPAAWVPFIEHYATLRGGEEVSLKGVADTARNRIDLDPSVCSSLGRYLRGIRPSKLSSENLYLAEALSVLTHQAEHLKAPSTSEAVAECRALQYVRPLVSATLGPEVATEIALHAWEIAYPRLPASFRSPGCRDGGPLDRNPGSSAWP